jgi:hypothetical protein
MVQRRALYRAFLHHDCTTFRRFLLELSHDIRQDELIGVQVLRRLGQTRVHVHRFSTPRLTCRFLPMDSRLRTHAGLGQQPLGPPLYENPQSVSNVDCRAVESTSFRFDPPMDHRDYDGRLMADSWTSYAESDRSMGSIVLFAIKSSNDLTCRFPGLSCAHRGRYRSTRRADE